MSNANLNINANLVSQGYPYPAFIKDSALYLSGKSSAITLNGSNVSKINSVIGGLFAYQDIPTNQPLATSGVPYSIGSYTTDDYLILDDNSLIDFTSTMSCYFWIKRSAVSGNLEMLVSKSDIAFNKAFLFYIKNNNNLTVSISQDGSAAESFESNLSITDTDWHFVGFDFNAINVRIFKDDAIESAATALASLYDSSVDLNIGNTTGFSFYFEGLLDNLLLTSEILTSDDIIELKNLKIQNTSYINGFNQIGLVEMGQSNMEGRDGDVPLHTILTGSGYFYNTVTGNLDHLTNDRGGANVGSHATYFAERLFNESGVIPVMSEVAVGSSALTYVADPNNNWSAISDVNDNRIDSASAASDMITKIGTNIPVALWSQGEDDADYMDANPGTYTKAIVKTAMQDVIDWWLGLYPNSYFLISQTGKRVGGDTAGFQTLRDIQAEIVSENSRVYMASTAAFGFVALGYMIDDVHYDFRGYEIMGIDFADELISILNL